MTKFSNSSSSESSDSENDEHSLPVRVKEDSSSSSSEDEDNPLDKILPAKSGESSPSPSSDDEDTYPPMQEPTVDVHEEDFSSSASYNPNPDLPVVLDTSSSDSDSDNENQDSSPPQVLNVERVEDEDSSSSSSDEEHSEDELKPDVDNFLSKGPVQPSSTLPIVLDTSSSESEDAEIYEPRKEENDHPLYPADTNKMKDDTSSSSSSSDDEEHPQRSAKDADTTKHQDSDKEDPPSSAPDVLDASSTSSESEEEETKDHNAVIPRDVTEQDVAPTLYAGDNLHGGGYNIEKPRKNSSSSSSSDSEKDDEAPTISQQGVESPPIVKSPENLPVVLDSSSSSSESEVEDVADIEPKVKHPDPASSDSSSSDSSEDEIEGNAEMPREPVNINTEGNPLQPAVVENSLHGENDRSKIQPSRKEENNSSSSSSSSESETEDDSAGPLVIRQKENKDDMAISLKKALEEREKELERRKVEEQEALGARKPPEAASEENDYLRTPSPEAFDFNGDPSLRARTALDFDETTPELPPKLPPKQRNLPPIVAPNIGVHRFSHTQPVPQKRPKSPQLVDIHPGIFHVKDKTASLGRGMWSDDDEFVDNDIDRPRHHSASSHPPPDRVIDFSNNPDGDHSLKRSRGRNKSGRKRSTSRRRSKEKRNSRSRSPSGSRPGHTVIDFSKKPYEDPQDAINRQAMVSLHANTYDTDAYDSVQETGDELNKLIAKANSLGIRHNYPAQEEDVFPKKKLKEKNLDSKHQDAFAKIVAPIPAPKSPQLVYRAVPQGPSGDQLSDNSRRSNRSTLKKKRKPQPHVEAVDGDDEISIAESDINGFISPPPIVKSDSSIPFLTTEVYPSDYTEFEDFSEAEFLDHKPVRNSSFSSDNTIQEPYHTAIQTGGESAYDTVADNDLETDVDFTPKAKLNPIVSANFQICSDLSANKSRSFPARIKEGKPKKERPSLAHVAIPLHQASKNKNIYPASLPYFANDFDDEDELDRVPRRTGSYDDIQKGIYPIVSPSIVVHRQPTHPKGYRPELMQEVMVQNSAPPPPLPEKKEKKKKEKKSKESSEKQQPVPQIRLSVEGENNENLNNNLQINLLPSNDPNIINLNIRSTSVNQSSEPLSLPVTRSQPNTYEPEMSTFISRNQAPVTALVHPPPHVSTLPQADNQHRVVEINAPPIVVTGDEIQPIVPYTMNGGVVLAAGVPTEVYPNPILAAAAQQFSHTTAQQPTAYPTVSLTQQPMMYQQPGVHASHSLPAPPVVDTSMTSVPTHHQPPLQPNNVPTVVDVHHPVPLPEDRAGSLPSSLRHGKAPGRLHHGDSGIDLTVHDRSRQRGSRSPKERRMKRTTSRSSARHDETSSSEEESSHRRRKSSRKKLKSNDYLANTGPSKEYMEWYKSKHLKPSCCYLFMKHVLFVINLLFTIAGLALIGLGIWGLTRLYSNGITDPNIIFLDPTFALMVVGFVVTLVAFHGAAGFVRDNICMLKCFGSFLVMLFIIFIVGGIVFWATMSKVKEFTISTFSEQIEHYDPETRVALTFSLDLMQNTFQCCGSSSSENWKKNKIYKCPGGLRCPLPSSCCAVQDPSFTCLATPNTFHDQACVEKMSSAVRDYTAIIVGVWIAIWALIVIELIFIYFMCKEIMYLQKIRDFIADPMKMISKVRQNHHPEEMEEESNDSSEEESSSDYTSSEEEYRRKRRKNKKSKKNKSERSRKKRKSEMGRRTASKRGRRGSYHVNRTFSIEDERPSRGRRSKGSRSRSRSRSRRGSY